MTRKLDALVHERVFGRPVKWTEKGKLLKADYDPDIDGIDLHVAVFHRAAMEVPDYLTDIAAAWQVLEEMRSDLSRCGPDAELWPRFVQELNEGFDFKVSSCLFYLCSDSICLAALHAVGVPEAEIQKALDADNTA